MLHKAVEGAIRLKTFPKTTVDIFALVLESGGSDFSVLISSASIALADAGIMLPYLVAEILWYVCTPTYRFALCAVMNHLCSRTFYAIRLDNEVALAVVPLFLVYFKKSFSYFGNGTLPQCLHETQKGHEVMLERSWFDKQLIREVGETQQLG
ncbi:hypothetical protein MLD38_006390 [Melastoma candidum]|uniref:Uncharacterized protein n=1 Tax=Melastoma candidum TaxID=119954 RepID=A0ACB9RMQ0_9MYRT|nr:hypothetical protein MLD38_006390 [Melastoma candidum]